jgi:hypothetical protein
MSKGTLPVPYWMADRDYYPVTDPRRHAHVQHIDLQNRISARIDACAGDGSYAVTIRREDRA